MIAYTRALIHRWRLMERTYRTMAKHSPDDNGRFEMLATVCRLRRLDLVRQWQEMRTVMVRAKGKVTT